MGRLIVKTVAECQQLLNDLQAMTEEQFDQFCKENNVIRRFCGIDARDELPRIIQNEMEFLQEINNGVGMTPERRKQAAEEFFDRKRSTQ